VVDIESATLKEYNVDMAFWAALGPIALQVAGNRVDIATLVNSTEFAAAKRQWINSSSVISGKIKTEAELEAQVLQVQPP
jgi:hypothetical protein